MDFKKKLAKSISIRAKISEDEVFSLIEVPTNYENGDFSFPCFKLAKCLKKSPKIIAKELENKIESIEFIEKIKAEGGYLNFYIKRDLFCRYVIEEVLSKKDKYGYFNMGQGKNIVIDFSSPNIAKPFHVGHLRSTVIGNALYNIFNCLGYKSIGINHLGDWGTQFGKLIVAYKLWGDKVKVEKEGIKELNKIYIKFHKEAEKDKSLNDKARLWFLKMEEGDEEALNLWKWFNDISIIEFNRVYKRLKISFDFYTGESFYNDKMDKIVKELIEKEILKESKGAQVVSLEEFNMLPCLILRSDGGTLYPTRDIAAAFYRKEKYNFEKCLYITAMDQKLHFDQWFKVIKLMGYNWYKDLIHIPFGLVKLEKGKLSTRKGNVVLMEELLNEAVLKTREIINKKNDKLKDKELISEQVGIGAIIFNDLYNSRLKDVVFSWDKMLNFDGETGPYVQYTYVRANSILRKAKIVNIKKIDYSVLNDKFSIDVIKLVNSYKEKIIESAEKYEPYILTRHLVDIAQSFNRFYHNNQIIVDCNRTREARLALVYAVKVVISNGLNILGISAPKEM